MWLKMIKASYSNDLKADWKYTPAREYLFKHVQFTTSKKNNSFFLLGFFQPGFLFKGYILYTYVYFIYIYILRTYSVIWCQICIYLTSSINLKAAKSQSFWETQNARDGVFACTKKCPGPKWIWRLNHSTWLSHYYLDITILDISPSQPATIWTTIFKKKHMIVF